MTDDLREYSEEDKETRSPKWIAPVSTWLVSEDSREVTGRVFQAGNGIFAVAEGWLTGVARVRGMWAMATLGKASLGACSLGSGLAFFFSRAGGGAGGSSSISLSAMRAKRPSLLSTIYSRRTRLVRPMMANTSRWTSREMPPIHAIDLVSLRRRGVPGRGVAAGTR